MILLLVGKKVSMDKFSSYPVVCMKVLMKIIKSLIRIFGVRNEIPAGGFILEEKLDI
jgi:hypothetical protein